MRIYLQINGKYIKHINRNYKYKKYFKRTATRDKYIGGLQI